MSWFWPFARRRKRPSELRITLYTRHGCHLCDEAWNLLERYRQRYGFQLEAADVDGDRQLAAQHGDWVPVVTVDGQVRFRGRVNEVLLKRLLESAW